MREVALMELMYKTSYYAIVYSATPNIVQLKEYYTNRIIHTFTVEDDVKAITLQK